MSEEILADFSDKKALPVTISTKDLPIDNLKVTESYKIVYTGLRLKQFKHLYLIAVKEKIYKDGFTAPEGSIVYLYHATGSWKHTRYLYKAFFKVASVGERKYTLKNLVERRENDVTITVNNLILLEPISDEELVEIEAEIINKHHARLSKYDPVKHLYYYFIKQKTVVDEVEELEREIKELEQTLMEKKKLLKKLRAKSRAKALVDQL